MQDLAKWKYKLLYIQTDAVIEAKEKPGHTFLSALEKVSIFFIKIISLLSILLNLTKLTLLKLVQHRNRDGEADRMDEDEFVEFTKSGGGLPVEQNTPDLNEARDN